MGRPRSNLTSDGRPALAAPTAAYGAPEELRQIVTAYGRLRLQRLAQSNGPPILRHILEYRDRAGVHHQHISYVQVPSFGMDDLAGFELAELAVKDAKRLLALAKRAA